MTIREHLEAIIEQGYDYDRHLAVARFDHAVAALAKLNAAPLAHGKYEGRIVPEPERPD